jgi:RimJ/RimL family protein N-acetyltransferase
MSVPQVCALGGSPSLRATSLYPMGNGNAPWELKFRVPLCPGCLPRYTSGRAHSGSWSQPPYELGLTLGKRGAGILLVRQETQRLVLLPIGPEDADDVWRLHQDPWITTWFAWAWTRQEAAAFADRCAKKWAIDGVCEWIAYHKDTGELVGRGGLSRMPVGATSTIQIEAILRDPGWMADRLEVGWSISAPYRGRGLAAEIGRAALAFAADDLGASRVIAFTERHNLASRRVMEKLGTAGVGEIYKRGLVEGQEDGADDAPFVAYATRHRQ